MTGTLTVEPDRQAGLVCVVGVGFWTPQYARQHFLALERAMLDVRRVAGRVRVLVDLREAAVQSKETAEVIGECTRRIYRDADRAAVVVETHLLKMQIKYSTEAHKVKAFDDMVAALRWLEEVGQEATA